MLLLNLAVGASVVFAVTPPTLPGWERNEIEVPQNAILDSSVVVGELDGNAARNGLAQP